MRWVLGLSRTGIGRALGLRGGRLGWGETHKDGDASEDGQGDDDDDGSKTRRDGFHVHARRLVVEEQNLDGVPLHLQTPPIHLQAEFAVFELDGGYMHS